MKFWIPFLLAASAAGQPFQPKCTLPSPLNEIRSQKAAIDRECALAGDAGDDQEKVLENLAKNNFCRKGTPIVIRYATLQSLQKASDLRAAEIKASLGSSRNPLGSMIKQAGQNIGEGTLVQFVAYIHRARPSNVDGGENVNCRHSGAANNDIHIELVMDPNEDDLCKSVTAEMSPHFRPDSWTEAIQGLGGTGRPVRITGPLFFDSSHQPCRQGRGSPARISVWEIHPVYAVDVCKSKDITVCGASVNSMWIPLHRWDDHSAETED